MSSYYKDVHTTTYVRYKLLDDSGKVLHDYGATSYGEPCFSAITYNTIPKGTAVIAIRHNKSQLPYAVPEIRRWVADINEMGFPCSFIEEVGPTEIERRKQYISATICADAELAQKLLCHGDKPAEQEQENYNFEIRLKDFEYKSHFISTLMLVRCLTEVGICKIPDTYFQLMDKNPGADKFDTMQSAHKTGYYGNTNHMITYKDNGSNVTKEKLWARYKACGFKVMDGEPETWHRHLDQSNKWKDEEIN